MCKNPFMIMLALMLCLVIVGCGQGSTEVTEATQGTEASEASVTSATIEAEPTETTESPTEAVIENVEQVGINIGFGMEITDIGDYTGIYMEDGSDELVSGVLMCVVTNTGESTIQYAKFNLLCGEETAQFEISTLRPGDRLVALEINRMAYQDGQTYSAVMAEDAALFDEEPGVQDERLSIQMLDGILNVTNISGEDISGDVVVYYKNAAADLLYGGITYRVRIEGGIPSGEVRQMPAGHMSQNGSEIMFVTIG